MDTKALLPKTDWEALLLAWMHDPFDKALRVQGTIDLDPTDDATHGAQQLSFFNGHYGGLRGRALRRRRRATVPELLFEPDTQGNRRSARSEI